MWFGIVAVMAATSFLSGILGMGGGIILMGVLVLLLPLASAMVLHALTQIAANGSRAWLHRRHIHWGVLRWYVLGGLAVLGLFFFLWFEVPKSWFFIGLGLMALLGNVLPKSWQLDVTRPVQSVVCGALVTAGQLFVGVAGSILDLFFIHARLNRYQVVATKAITQTSGHLMKLTFYGSLVFSQPQSLGIPFWVYVAVIPAAFLGTRLGAEVLHRLDDQQFRRYTRWVLNAVGVVYITRGVLMML
ncbi:hypothetical protein BGP77_12985 [Saccharospirillum sp. MSK14-1]|uniref:sulfite exporter TauE/SafE family protein n=1 Tax=Saccharospirillum sp. MSK14-1 TaxID=1897632 RepID=UPI000D3D80A9|nr:sulfite exporter TauE/SafE family protein [Saccharospirillum sp. MSK14-1]PTY37417.1 hypothetical protein BGP77_12985 [Saccharospirillum sp. MSK14-1]